MLHSAMRQFLGDVIWGDLDYLFIDMPPGTGDIQLSLSQKANVNGSVIVSTPQDLALIDARKGLNMFRKVNIPVLGIIENMSYFICPSCNEQTNIFGNGGAQKEAERLGVDFLGAIPLDTEIRLTSDQGKPITEINRNITRNKVQRTKFNISDNIGKNAITKVSNIKTFHVSISLLDCEIITGRTHQIRVHLLSLGLPIIGDNNNLNIIHI